MEKFKNILILAGGESSRFWPLIKKPFFRFFGRPLIEHQIKEFFRWAENIFVVYNRQDKEDIEKLKRKLGPSVYFIGQALGAKGQGGAVLSAKDRVKGEVLIVNANDVFDPEMILPKILRQRKEKGGGMIFVGKKMRDYFPGGYLKFEGNKLAGLVEKPPPNNRPSDVVKLVIDYLADFKILVKMLEKKKTGEDDWYERGLSHLIERGFNSHWVLYDGDWATIKYPWQVLRMKEFFLKKMRKNHWGKGFQLAKTAVISPPVYLKDKVKIGEFSKIVGPCYIGSNTVVGDNVLIRESHIEDGCLVGGYSEVARSYLGRGVMLHHNYIGDSVLDDQVLIGYGAATANFRFDEKGVRSLVRGRVLESGLKKLGAIIGRNSRVGVNATLLPGVKIGSETFIGPGELVAADVADRRFVFKGEIDKNRFY